MQTSTVNRHAPAPLTYQQAMEIFEVENVSSNGVYRLKSTVNFPLREHDGTSSIIAKAGLSGYRPEKFDESLYKCTIRLVAEFYVMASISCRQTKASAVMTNLSALEHIQMLFNGKGSVKTEIEKRGFGCVGRCNRFIKVLFAETRPGTFKPILDDRNKPLKYEFDEDFCRMVAQGLKHKMMQAAAQSVQPPQTTTVNPVFAHADIQAAQQLAAQFLGN